ncbi:MAG TPA: ABC transporter permease [Thermoanaerobaculia bacterium]
MSRMIAIFKREYLHAVRRKVFIIMTLLLPLLMAAAVTLPALLAGRGLNGKRIDVIDGTGALRAEIEKPVNTIAATLVYVDGHGQADLKSFAKPTLDRMRLARTGDANRIDAVVLVPPTALQDSKVTLRYYSRSSTDLIGQAAVSLQLNSALQRQRLVAHGLTPGDAEVVLHQADVEAIQLGLDGTEQKGGRANFIIGFVFAALLVIPVVLYGVDIMRGVVAEKSDRVIEVLLSSVDARELLTGKILGIAAVGLTQLGVWTVMGLLVAGFFGAVASTAGVDIAQFLHPMTFVLFAVFFLLAYMTWVCMYAIGGAVSNSEKEAQQLVAPLMLLMMLPWFLMVPIITNPDSRLTIFLSLFPLFSPITMFVRTLVSNPPAWQVAASIVISVATIVVLCTATIKIFRIGILAYGKRPTIQELLRWVKVA